MPLGGASKRLEELKGPPTVRTLRCSVTCHPLGPTYMGRTRSAALRTTYPGLPHLIHTRPFLRLHQLPSHGRASLSPAALGAAGSTLRGVL